MISLYSVASALCSCSNQQDVCRLFFDYMPSVFTLLFHSSSLFLVPDLSVGRVSFVYLDLNLLHRSLTILSTQICLDRK